MQRHRSNSESVHSDNIIVIPFYCEKREAVNHDEVIWPGFSDNNDGFYPRVDTLDLSSGMIKMSTVNYLMECTAETLKDFTAVAMMDQQKSQCNSQQIHLLFSIAMVGTVSKLRAYA